MAAEDLRSAQTREGRVDDNAQNGLCAGRRDPGRGDRPRPRTAREAGCDLYNYCSAALPYMRCTPLEVLDWAFAQRAMPALLATASLDGLHILNKLLPDMPRSLSLLTSSMPLPPL